MPNNQEGLFKSVPISLSTSAKLPLAAKFLRYFLNLILNLQLGIYLFSSVGVRARGSIISLSRLREVYPPSPKLSRFIHNSFAFGVARR